MKLVSQGAEKAGHAKTTDRERGDKPCRVSQLEAQRQLEVQLDGGTLMAAAQRIHDGDVDLGPVEGAVARIQLPRNARLVHAVLQLLRKRGGVGDIERIVCVWRRKRRRALTEQTASKREAE